MSPPRQTLNRHRIITGALELIDRDDVDGLSMRKLGKHLGVDAMTIYGYFDSKAELLGAVVSHVAQSVTELPEPIPNDPVDIFIAAAMHYRDTILAHPNLAPLVVARPLQARDVAANAMNAIALLRASGIDEEHLVVAAGMFTRFGLGFILHEALQTGLLATIGVDRDEHRAEVQEALDELGASSIEKGSARRQDDPDAAREEFEFGLRLLISGLQKLSQPEEQHQQEP